MQLLRSADSDEAATESHLEPIRIFTSELELDGHVAPAGQRVTDMLLRGQDLSFLPAGAPEEPERWISIAPPDLLFVVPAPLNERGRWHAPGTRRDVTLEVGPYRVRGTAHLPNGVPSASALKARQAFIPLTGVAVSRLSEAAEERFEVVIVHVAHAFVWDDVAAPASV